MMNKKKQPKKCEIKIKTTLFDIGSTNGRFKSWREQSNKILEEAAEVFSSMRRFEGLCIVDNAEQVSTKWDMLNAKWDALDEMADVIQATLNLAYKLDFNEHDIEEAMERCEQRNKARGRC